MPKTNLNNENGMSILQVLIVLGILVASMFAGLQLVVNSKTYSQTTRQTIEMSMLQAEINNALLNEDSCRQALGGPMISLMSPGNVGYSGHEQKFTVAGQPNIILYRTVADGTLYGTQKVFLNPQLYTANPTDPNRPLFTFGPLAITGISLNQYKTGPFPGVAVPFPGGQNPPGLVPPAKNMYMAQLTITALRSGINTTAGFGNPPIIRSDIVMSVQTDAQDRIISCSSVTFVSDNGNIGVPPVCLPGQALYTHNGGVSCANYLCPAANPNPIPGQWNADGSPTCGP